MRRFEEVYRLAAERKGGRAALESLLVHPVPLGTLARRSGSEWLSLMTRCVFQAGFNWKVIDAKWDGFVAAFDQFDPATVARYGEPDIDRLLGDQGIVRNLHKIEATIKNAAFILDVQAEHGSFGAFLALYPPSGYSGLLTELSRRGGRLSGTTGQRVLRQGGYPSYILTPDVIAALVREGIVDGASSSGKAMARIQAAFDRWEGESGRSLTELSQVLAHSV